MILKKKRKRLPGKNHQATRSISSVSLPHAKVIVNHQKLDAEAQAFEVNANILGKQ